MSHDVATFIICPGCGIAYSKKGLAPHVFRAKGQPCRDAYERVKNRRGFNGLRYNISRCLGMGRIPGTEIKR